MPEADTIAADNIDRVMNIEMRRRGLPRGKNWLMFEMAREMARAPLVLAGARVLDRNPCRVLILTGAAVPDHMPVGENDGPIGTVVLAKALVALGHTVTVLTDPVCAAPVVGLAKFLQLPLKVVEIGLDDKPLQDKMVDTHDVFVSVERLGGNINGRLHGVNGVRRDHHRANLDHVFKRAIAEKKPTLGIGDGGNEIGFGNIFDRISKEMAGHAYKEVTPCGGGVFSVVRADMLVVANSSNIGAYGVCAGLALLRGRTDLCHDAELDINLHHVGAGLGLVDGANGMLRAWCDGIPPEANAAVVTLIRNIVERELEAAYVRKF